MKKWLLVLATVALGTGAFASEDWNTDFAKASAKAKAEGKYILIDFSGSDWCGWCKKLDKEVFSKKTFKKYAKENLILVMADFPRDDSKQSVSLKKQNKALAKKFKIRGFPTVFILDPNGKTINKTGYQAGGPEAYVEYIKKAIAIDKEKKAKAKAATATAK
jgi:protein disulfide-isomerase